MLSHNKLEIINCIFYGSISISQLDNVRITIYEEDTSVIFTSFRCLRLKLLESELETYYKAHKLGESL